MCTDLKRIFIVGCPRSGTTWMALLLGHHPEIAVCTHSWLFDGCLDHVRRWFDDEYFGKRVLVFRDAKRSLADARLVHLLAEDEFLALCRQFADGVYEKIASANHSRVIVDQTPSHVYAAETILRLFPDAYFLHMIRDPRSVVCSMRAAAWDGFPTTAVDGARMWCDAVAKGRQIAGATPRYLEVRYEALLQDGVDTLARTLTFLDLPWSQCEVAETVDACRIERLRVHPVAPSQFFRNGQALGWQAELSRGDTRLIEFIARDQMKELGYAPSQPASRMPWSLWLRDTIARLAPTRGTVECARQP